MKSRVLIALVTFCVLLLCVYADASPSISTITTDLTSIKKYGRFTVNFNVTTIATNLYWPYDPNPAANITDHPDAVPAGIGISVDGLFLPPGESDWSKAIVQPAFYYQPYNTDPENPSRRLDTDDPWIYPDGDPKWQIRFAPTQIGTWQYKIRATDSSGTSTSSTATFNCIAGTSHGFVRVSPTDSRYFELSDGTYLPIIGGRWDDESDFPTLGSIGINLVRPWWQSSNAPFALFGAGGQGGDMTWRNVKYDTANVYPGQLASVTLPNKYNVWECVNADVAVKPGTSYKITAIVKTVGITGSSAYGVFLGESFSATKSSYLTGDNDWTQISLSVTTPSYRYQNRVYVGMDNVTSGDAYLAKISMREDLGGGKYGPELLPRNEFQPQAQYSQNKAWRIDRQLEAAEANNIYVKPVIEEKGDTFFARICADGTFGDYSEGNVVATATHACRTYQTYYWRYLIARYGYSTALHSVELFNEGDPNSITHQNAAAALGQYFRANDPNKHMVSTSNWHSVAPIMWSDPNIDIADMHRYVGWKVPGGGNRIYAGWDGSMAIPNNSTTLGDNFEFDNTVSHSGTTSLKVTLPATAEDNQVAYTESNLKFQFAAEYGHQLRMTCWMKSSNLHKYSSVWYPNFFFEMSYAIYGGDWIHSTAVPVTVLPDGTEGGWVKYTKTWTVDSDADVNGNKAKMEWCRLCQRGNYDSSPGYIWIDDLVIEDLTTGQVLNYNGGFEDTQPESYDIAACHCSCSRMLRGFDFGKPVFRGETGICNTGGTSEEDPAVANDTAGIWWKQLVWSHLDPGGLIDIYWWCERVVANQWPFGKVYLNFMSGIPLSNGKYEDIAASTSNPAIRVVGQKDLTNNLAHLWIHNKPYIWKSVVDGAAIPAAGGTITVSGLKDATYQVEWWDTSSGAIKSNEEITCSGGNLTLDVANLQSDVACKIYLLPAKVDLRILVPSSQVIPGQTVTVTVEYTNNGETDGHNVVVMANVPNEMEYVAGSAEETGGTWDSVNRSVTWVIESVAAHETGTRTFRAIVE